MTASLQFFITAFISSAAIGLLFGLGTEGYLFGSILASGLGTWWVSKRLVTPGPINLRPVFLFTICAASLLFSLALEDFDERKKFLALLSLILLLLGALSKYLASKS